MLFFVCYFNSLSFRFCKFRWFLFDEFEFVLNCLYDLISLIEKS